MLDASSNLLPDTPSSLSFYFDRTDSYLNEMSKIGYCTKTDAQMKKASQDLGLQLMLATSEIRGTIS